MTGRTGSMPSQRPVSRYRWPLRAAALAGVGYTVSWVVGLSIFSASTDVRSSAGELLTAYTGHRAVAILQFVFTEGLPAVALAVVVYALARSARVAGERRGAGVVLATGLGAAVVSLVQCLLGLDLTGRLVPDRPDTAVSVFEAISRLDGVKMFLLAALAVTGFALIRRGRLGLPRWLTWLSLALAVAIAISGIGYLFLLSAPALAAWISLPLLLAWVTSLGVLLARRGR